MKIAINWKSFSTEVQSRMQFGDTMRQRAREIGVQHHQLGRALSGKAVSTEAMVAICRWLGMAVEDFVIERTPAQV